jgi:hypothetical protein
MEYVDTTDISLRAYKKSPAATYFAGNFVALSHLKAVSWRIHALILFAHSNSHGLPFLLSSYYNSYFKLKKVLQQRIKAHSCAAFLLHKFCHADTIGLCEQTENNWQP